MVPLFAWFSALFFSQPEPTPQPQLMEKSFHSFRIESISGDEIQMADYKGKYILCVNVASKCGFTPQYKDLQALYERYQDKLVIIGFPCNQFMRQEPGSNAEIASFCERNYGVTFPLTTKIDVKGKNQHPIYQWLTNQEVDGKTNHTVKWNFHKFLVNPEGKLVGVYSSRVNPQSPEIVTAIQD